MTQPARVWRAAVRRRRDKACATAARFRNRPAAHRSLRLEPLETRTLLAVFVPVNTVDVTGVVSVNAQYDFYSFPQDTESTTRNFTANSNPPAASVGMDTARTFGVYADSATASITRQVSPDSVHIESQANLEAVRQTPLPPYTFIARSVNVSYALQTPQAIRFRIDPSPGEQIGDMVGVDLRVLVDGQVAGRDADTAPEGSYSFNGQYSYQFRVLSPGEQASRSGSGVVPVRVGSGNPLDDAREGPVNVPIGGEIEIQWTMSGGMQTSDLQSASTLVHALSVDLRFAAADLSAQALAWNLHTAGSPQKLDFTYAVEPAHDPLSSNVAVGFYWAAGTTRQDILGSINSPAYRYTIDAAAQKTAGDHSASVLRSNLGAQPDEATHLLMLIDPDNTIAEWSKTNNLLAIGALPDVEAAGLDWNTRRDADPFGGWRGLDARYSVKGGVLPANTDVAFYWSTDGTWNGRVGGALAARSVATDAGLHQFNDSALWGAPLDGAKYILMVADPENQVDEADETNNVVAIRVHSAGEVLAGAIDLNPLGSGAQSSLTVYFRPGGGQYTMSEAEVALGVHHFNWLQQVYAVPQHWSLYQDYGGRVDVPLPWFDPSKDVPNQSYLVLHSTQAGDERFASNPNDAFVFYYNEPGSQPSNVSVMAATKSGYLKFFDAPRVPSDYLGPSEAWSFIASLQGVDAQNRIVPMPAPQQRTFTWKSNAVYDRANPGNPVIGGGVFLQVFDEAGLPNLSAGGVQDVAMAEPDLPVARDDYANTLQNESVVVRVLANDNDPRHEAIAIEYVGTPRHGAVTVNDAGTPGDPSDDWLIYAPAQGFVGDDSFDYLISRPGGSAGSAPARVYVNVASPVAGMGAAGDDLTAEYAEQAHTYARSWVELLAAADAVPFGPQGAWGDPRWNGYAYDWARAGATSSTLLLSGQHTGLAQQATQGLVSHAVLMIGQNDFVPGAGGAYQGVYWQGMPGNGGWTAAQIQTYTDKVVANVQTAIQTLKAGGAKLVVSTLIDYGLTPFGRNAYPLSARREFVASVLDGINQRIAALATQYRVTLVDTAAMLRAMLGTHQVPTASQTIGGVTFSNTSGVDAHNLFVVDGFHPHTALQAEIANLVLRGFRLGYETNLSELSESQIVALAGLQYGGQDTLGLNLAQYVTAPPNQAPVAGNNVYYTEQGKPLVIDALAGLLAGDRDPNGDRLSAAVQNGGPSHGTLVLNPNGSFSYTPTADFQGADSFQYLARDGFTHSNLATVTIHVTTPGKLQNATTPGLYVPNASFFHVRNSTTAGPADAAFGFGVPKAGWLPVTGDWNGDQAAGVALYNPATSIFYLCNKMSTGKADKAFGFGAPGLGWIPLAGDWDGDGVDSAGLYDPVHSRFFLRNTQDTGFADLAFGFGAPGAGWIPLVGDWNADGVDTVGLYDPATSRFFLRNSHTTGFADLAFGYGAAGAGWKPVAGDWNGDGVDTVGLYNPATSYFFLTNAHSGGYAALAFGFGAPGAGWAPLAGDWDASRSQPLLAAPDAGIASNASSITLADLQPAVDAAIARFQASGLDAATVDRLARVQWTLADLDGDLLGRTLGNRVALDLNAAGRGWFVDPTPASNEEFTRVGDTLHAVDPRALDRIDLVSVVSHELGHIAGLDDLAPALPNLMSATLPAGIRRVG